MEFGGDEKRIQALFSELSREDQSRAPRFEKLCQPLEITARATPLVSLRSVTSFAALILALVSLVAASRWYGTSEFQYVGGVPAQNIPSVTNVPLVRAPEQLVSSNVKTSRAHPQRRPARRRQPESLATREIAMLSSWQSPTNVFLQSPATLAFGSLPRLTESARDLEMFLPKNEVIKESKQ